MMRTSATAIEENKAKKAEKRVPRKRAKRDSLQSTVTYDKPHPGRSDRDKRAEGRHKEVPVKAAGKRRKVI